MTARDEPRRFRTFALHAARVGLFVITLVLIHFQHARMLARRNSVPFAPVEIQRVRQFFPQATSLGEVDGRQGRREVLDEAGTSLGYLVQTSPQSDHIIGFSGPTNVLIAFSANDRLLGVDILSSGDTREHVAQILASDAFLPAFRGVTWDKASELADVDAVSGATLTSLAIQESIILRLSGGQPSLKFPDPLTLAEARQLFEQAGAIMQDDGHASEWHVFDNNGIELGTILRTSPAADNIIGYQGPTETWIGFDPQGRVQGILLGKSYDNEEYVAYVRDDEYFLTLFNELVLEKLAQLDFQQAGVEGVSGATMTSMAVAEGLVRAAELQQQAALQPAPLPQPLVNWTLRDLGTAMVIVSGLIIALTPLRGNKPLRVCFQLVLIGYLGLINGDMLSQAMLVGWAQNGIPWNNAGGLVLLTIAAFLVPMTTRRNAYCTHLCPHGAVQQLLKNRLPWRWRLTHNVTRVLKLVPGLLLAWCVIVPMASLPFSLVDIEPFDAWVFRIAGWATITIAVVGLVASLFVPMAYCRFGCPTGLLLNALRRNARSDHWSPRDWLATALVLVACGLWLLEESGHPLSSVW